jgi:AICAR transformylase/IMP cyclohydrolase PurH
VFVRDGVGAWSQQAYVKASNTDASDRFGDSVALSDDGNTLAVGLSGRTATRRASAATRPTTPPGIAERSTCSCATAGAWSQQAYVKASNTDNPDFFGSSVALSDDGNTLAVGATEEDSDAKGVGGDQADNSGLYFDGGAVYLY